MVFNHSSHLHPWFVESRSSRHNAKRDWYIWHEGKNGKPPNNWLSVFGGSAWQWDEKTQSYYLHSFLSEQPDLNWRNLQVKEAVFSEIEFWLKKGVDGFRLDVVNCFFKDELMRNNPWQTASIEYQRDLPLNNDYADCNVDEQLNSGQSILHWYKDLLQLRKKHKV